MLAFVPPLPPGFPQHMVQQLFNRIPNCPPGLEYLTQVDSLNVKQDVELLEVLTGFETKNKYKVFNVLNQPCFKAYEESGCMMRQCCGANREFVLHITDNFGMEVIRASRPFKCARRCFSSCGQCCAGFAQGLCAQELTVEAPPGTVIGRVWETCSFYQPRFLIEDANANPVFTVRGPGTHNFCCSPCCPFTMYFDVLPFADRTTVVGGVAKTYGGCCKEAGTNATNFNIIFPMDLDVRMKATIFAMTFLFDFMYFETGTSDGGGNLVKCLALRSATGPRN